MVTRWFPSLVLLATICFVKVQSSEPSLTASQPRHGDQDVPAETKEIVVSFDQDMNTSGYSFTGGGPAFPRVRGMGIWRSARECVLPVDLEPGRSYSVGINSATHTGFKSVAGTPAQPTVITFKTRAAGAGPKAPMSPALAMESVRQLREAIDRRYSYRDVHLVDWPALRKTFEPRLEAARSPREFAVIAGEMLAATRDPHIWLVEAGEIVPAFRRTAVPNANIKVLPGLIEGWSQRHPMVATGQAGAGISYIAIHSWEEKRAPGLLEAALAALAQFTDSPALILDVRFNSGGDEYLARTFAGCFVRERARYARHVTLDPSSASGFSAPVERWLEPTSSGRPAYTGRVAVLMGPANMSSAEAFLLMMKQAPHATLIGERSFGSSGNPQPHALANGVTVVLPSWKAMLPDGTVFETKGIPPDIEVPCSAKELTRRDPALEKAKALLKN